MPTYELRSILSAEDVFVGVQDDGRRVYVSVNIDERDAGQSFDTIDHEPVNYYTRVAITGMVTARASSEVEQVGQCIEELEKVSTLQNGFTEDDVNSLVEIWRCWHLNDLQAGCAHMDLPQDPSYDVRKDIRCPLTGYKYGSAWLVQVVPDEVVARLQQIFSTPHPILWKDHS